MSVFRMVSPSLRKAVDFLETELKEDAKSVIELQRNARSEGITVHTLSRARKHLRISVTRDSSGKCFWNLNR